MAGRKGVVGVSGRSRFDIIGFCRWVQLMKNDLSRQGEGALGQLPCEREDAMRTAVRTASRSFGRLLGPALAAGGAVCGLLPQSLEAATVTHAEFAGTWWAPVHPGVELKSTRV